MRRVFGVGAMAAAICLLVAGAVSADRVILTPTGNTITGIKAEYANRTGGDGTIYWASFGASRIEVEGARFQDFGDEDSVDAISAQLSLIPETTFTPAVSAGIRDIGNSTSSTNSLYGGRALYLAASKTIPVTGGIPLLFQNVRLSAGIGTESLSGLFFGVEGDIPMGLHVRGEYDTEDWNFSVGYSIIPAIRATLSTIKGDTYYGAYLSTTF